MERSDSGQNNIGLHHHQSNGLVGLGYYLSRNYWTDEGGCSKDPRNIPSFTAVQLVQTGDRITHTTC